jgi:hypothetical protein
VGDHRELPKGLRDVVPRRREDADHVRQRRQGIPVFHNPAWRMQGIPVELLVYEEEGHTISRPENQRDLLTRVIAWFDKWLVPARS